MTLVEIRNALLILAQERGCPHFEMYVAKELYWAIKMDLPHPLRDAVEGIKPAETALSKSNVYAGHMAFNLDKFLSEKKAHKDLVLQKLRIKPEFLFDMRFGLIPESHPIWTEVEAVLFGGKNITD